MEMIAPSAKVLAEANGIDWRNITGTGSGGQIVDEDILTYLMRIMTGDEEPPATPVDLPPADWAGDMAAMNGMNVQALAAAGIDSDITDFVASTRNDQPADLTSDASDFELELDEDDDASDVPVIAADADEAAELEIETPAHVTPPASSSPGIAGGLLSSLYRRPESEATAQPEPVHVPTPVEPEPVHVEPVAAQAEPEIDTPAPLHIDLTPVAEAEPEVVDPEPVQPEPVSVEPAAQAQPVQPEPQPEPVAAQVQPEPVQPAPAPVVPQPVAEPVAAAAPAIRADPVAAPSERRYTTLRLSFAADALVAARGHIAEHFEREVPLSVFVARAAARRVEILGLSSVGVLGVGDEVAPVATPNLGGDFRSAVTDLHGAEGGSFADLMVLDAGELGLDELQIPHDGVVLSLGRVRDGSATLTLTGNVPVRAGAAFVQGVAELLETPIRLML